MIGRFLSVDPFSGKFPSESPFVFGGNNPINMTDYNGYFKISPWFAKRYPSLARFLQYGIPTLKMDAGIRDNWIQSMGILDKKKGIEIWNLLLTYGSGPYVDPDRPDDEFRGGWSVNLNDFAFGHYRGGIYGDIYGYPNNLSIGYGYFDDVEASLKKGDNIETGYRMFLMFIMIMHEGGHWARNAAGLPERGGFRNETEDGAMSEEGIFGTRFNYTSGFSTESDALNTKKATDYYNSIMRSIGNVGKGLVIPKISVCWSIRGFSSLPSKGGHSGDKTITDNHDNENDTPPKHRFSYEYKKDDDFYYQPNYWKKD